MYELNRWCWTHLDGSVGECNCRRHTFLRGQRFSNTKFIPGWEESFCMLYKGYFTGKCDNIPAGGRNKDTICPKNKFWVGIKKTGGRAHKDEGGLDQATYRCCELVYREPDSEIKEGFKIRDDIYKFFNNDRKRFLRSDDYWVDAKDNAHEHWE